MQQLDRKYWIWFYALGIGLLFLAFFQLFSIHRDLEISILDVGQGDAILIQTPEHHNILIDAGPDSAVVDQLGSRIGFFDKAIDLFVLTHPHRDHHGGILDVMQKYEIKKVLLTGAISKDPVYLAFLDEIRHRNIDILFNQSHQDIQIGLNLYLDILYPFEGRGLVGQDVQNKNNTSVVARLVRRNLNGLEALAMLTGDAEMEEEREILLSGQDVQSNTLKLGHHGSRTATSDAFLAAVSPTIVIVSAGIDNKFEHPHPETMEKVKDLDARQTMDGAVEIVW
ncbi:ComEC/Rec2 family competence protein [candidate division KSB1 bacterium]